MKAHLSDAELAEILSAPSFVPGSHAEQCEQCRSEIEGLRRALQGLPEWAQSASARPEEFWRLQRGKVGRAVETATAELTQPMPRLAWAAATAIIVVATILLSSAPAPAPTPNPPVAQVDSDHELLLEVERVVESGGPDALAPATLLLQQVSQSSSDLRVQNTEMSHEN